MYCSSSVLPQNSLVQGRSTGVYNNRLGIFHTRARGGDHLDLQCDIKITDSSLSREHGEDIESRLTVATRLILGQGVFQPSTDHAQHSMTLALVRELRFFFKVISTFPD